MYFLNGILFASIFIIFFIHIFKWLLILKMLKLFMILAVQYWLLTNWLLIKRVCTRSKFFLIYDRAYLPTFNVQENSNFIEIPLCHGCSLIKLLHIFRTPFLKSTSEWLLLNAVTVLRKAYTQMSIQNSVKHLR